MLLRSMVIWLGILVLASINGAGRDLLLKPHLGDTMARAVSTIVLCIVILLVTWLTINWVHPGTSRQALALGGSWLGLTLAFEFLAGHYVFHKSWAVLLADYDVRRGRIWIAVLIVTMLSPLWAARMRGLLAD